MSDLLPADADPTDDVGPARAPGEVVEVVEVVEPVPGTSVVLSAAVEAADTVVSAGTVVVRIVEAALRRAGQSPLRARTSRAGALGGRLDVVVFELRSLDVAGVPVERLLLRAESLRVAPGLPPRLQATKVNVKVRVTQEGLDQWRRRLHLPVSLHFTSDGIAVRGRLAGRALGQLTARVVADGPVLRLRNVNASVFGVRAPGLGYLPVLVPLPPLPAGARLERIDHDDAALTAWLDLGQLDEPITLSLARRLVNRFVAPRFFWRRTSGTARRNDSR